jgi:DNA-binding transcriptional regulator YiaG
MLITEHCFLLRHVACLKIANELRLARSEAETRTLKELTKNPNVKTGKVFAADVRRSKIHPTVRKLTAWRQQNKLSQTKAVAVLGKYYFHITFAAIRSWEEGRRSPHPHTAQILEQFLHDHPTVSPPK